MYPTLKKYEEFNEMALEAVEEHLQVKTLLRDCRSSDNSLEFFTISAEALEGLSDLVQQLARLEDEGLIVPPPFCMPTRGTVPISGVLIYRRVSREPR